jgi:nucleoside-diphosphate-sugar epimerase
VAGGVTSLAGGAAHVAGGRGFLGAAVVRALRLAGRRVSVSGREGMPPRTADEASAEVETLIWCAGGREGAPAALWQVHVEAACAAVSGCPALRALIYVSSGEVYGAQAVPYLEEAPRLGVSHYALAKIRGEDALSALCSQRGIDLTIVRPSVIYGPAQLPPQLFPSAIERLLRGEALPVTSGEQTRDWIFVDDVAAAIAAVVHRRATGTFNVASDREVSVRHALTLLAEQLGGGAPAHIQWGALPYREHETMRYALDAARARAQLDWAPRVSLEEGMAVCVRAARSAAPGGGG